MTDTEILEIITSHNVKWEQSWKEHEINYFAIANIGRELVLDVKLQKNLDRVKNVLNEVESILISASQNELNLIGAGMFESMQTNALDEFTSETMDSLDEYLGPISLKLWRDIIEGWHGDGIRSMKDYSKILVNGIVEDLSVHICELNFTFKVNGKSLGTDFTPFSSDKFVRHRDYDEPITLPYIKLKFNENTELIIGGFVDDSKVERFIYDDTCRVHTISTTRLNNLMKKLNKKATNN
jgi:hypothetical protein